MKKFNNLILSRITIYILSTILSTIQAFSQLENNGQILSQGIHSDRIKVDFGVLKLGDSLSLSFNLVNSGTDEVNIKEIKLKKNLAEFRFTTKPWPFTSAPGEKKTITITASPITNSDYPVRDSVMVVIDSDEIAVTELTLRTTDPVIWITDADFGCQLLGLETSQKVTISNSADAKVVITGPPVWNDKNLFTHTSLDSFSNWPIVIAKGSNYIFNVYFKPIAIGNFYTTAWFPCNTEKSKFWSDWKGCGKSFDPSLTPLDWGIVHSVDSCENQIKFLKTGTINYTGDTIMSFIALYVQNDPDHSFSVDQPSITSLPYNTPIQFNAYFSPTHTGVFTATLTLRTSYKGNQQEVSTQLRGIGAVPHVKVNSNYFGSVELTKNSDTGFVQINQFTTDSFSTISLKLFDLQIKGIDSSDNCPECFNIDSTWYLTRFNENGYITIPIGDSIEIPIVFTAKEIGLLKAHLVSIDNACEGDEVHSCLLTGTGIKSTNGINENTEYYQKFSISPNPVRDMLIIRNNRTNLGPVNIKITNQIGVVEIEKYISQSDNSQYFQINTSNLTSGIYFLILNFGNENNVLKIIVLK